MQHLERTSEGHVSVHTHVRQALFDTYVFKVRVVQGEMDGKYHLLNLSSHSRSPRESSLSKQHSSP